MVGTSEHCGASPPIYLLETWDFAISLWCSRYFSDAAARMGGYIGVVMAEEFTGVTIIIGMVMAEEFTGVTIIARSSGTE